MAEPFVVFNPTDSPVVIDGEGHIVGGKEWRALDGSTAEVRAAEHQGSLIRVTYDGDEEMRGLNPDARAAFKDLAEMKAEADKAEQRAQARATRAANKASDDKGKQEG